MISAGAAEGTSQGIDTGQGAVGAAVETTATIARGASGDLTCTDFFRRNSLPDSVASGGEQSDAERELSRSPCQELNLLVAKICVEIGRSETLM